MALYFFYFNMGRIQLTVIGCGDAFSSGGRNQTCFYVKTESRGILIDCGADTLTELKKQQIKTGEIDTIILTHFHGDHFAGLPFFVLNEAKEKRKEKLTIISPPGAEKKLKQALQLFYPGTKPMKVLDVSFLEFSGGAEVEDGSITFESFPVKHRRETQPHGIRLLIEGKVIAFTGDTEWTDTRPKILADADIGICECTFYNKELKGHLSYRILEEHLQEIHCKRLLLTHLDEEMLAQMDKIPQECAYDGMTIVI